MRWTELVAHVGGKKIPQEVWYGNLEERKNFGNLGLNVKKILNASKTGWQYVIWMQLALAGNSGGVLCIR